MCSSQAWISEWGQPTSDIEQHRVMQDPIKAARRAILIATGQLPNPRETAERVTVTVEARDGDQEE